MSQADILTLFDVQSPWVDWLALSYVLADSSLPLLILPLFFLQHQLEAFFFRVNKCSSVFLLYSEFNSLMRREILQKSEKFYGHSFVCVWSCGGGFFWKFLSKGAWKLLVLYRIYWLRSTHTVYVIFCIHLLYKNSDADDWNEECIHVLRIQFQ